MSTRSPDGLATLDVDGWELESAVEIATERLWVYVTGLTGAVYHGRLQTEPSCTEELRPGAAKRFPADHIADIDDPLTTTFPSDGARALVRR